MNHLGRWMKTLFSVQGREGRNKKQLNAARLAVGAVALSVLAAEVGYTYHSHTRVSETTKQLMEKVEDTQEQIAKLNEKVSASTQEMKLAFLAAPWQTPEMPGAASRQNLAYTQTPTAFGSTVSALGDNSGLAAVDSRKIDAIAMKLAQMDERQGNFSVQLEDMAANISAAGQSGSDVDESIAALAEGITSLSEKIEALEASLAAPEEAEPEEDPAAEKLEALSTGITGLSAKLDSMEGSLDSTQSFTDVNAKIDSLTEQMASIGEKMNSLDAKTDTLAGQVTGLEEKVGSLDTTEDFQALNTKIDTLTSESQETRQFLTTRQDETTEKISSLEGTLEENKNASGERFDSLEETITTAVLTLDPSEADKAFQESLDNLESQLTEVSEKLAAMAVDLDSKGETENIKAQLSTVADQLDELASAYGDVDTKVCSIVDTIVPVEPVIEYIDYTVKSGDTMMQICMDNGVNYHEVKDEIKELNNLSDLSLLYVNQVVRIPVVKNKAEIDAQKKNNPFFK